MLNTQKNSIFYLAMFGILITLLFAIEQRMANATLQFSEMNQQLINKQGRLLVEQIETEILSIRRQMQAVANNFNINDDLAKYSQPSELPDSYFLNLKLFFPTVEDFFLVDESGIQFGSAYSIELGDACVNDINSVIKDPLNQQGKYQPILHPQFGRVHFDMMFPVELFNSQFLFFASINAQILVSILKAHKISKHASYLIRRDKANLIEATELVARGTDAFLLDYFLSANDIDNIGFREDIKGTGWTLVIVRNKQVYEEFNHNLVQQALIELLIVLFLWAMIFFFAWRYLNVQKRLIENLHNQSTQDELTGLGNRRALNVELPKTLERFKRRNAYAGLLYLDLNDFKSINDLHGHDIGDEVLKTVANRLVAVSRIEDVHVRLGGDEFVVLINELGAEESTACANLEHVSKRYQEVLNVPYEFKGMLLRSPPSIGCLFIDGQELDPDTLIKQADHLMYEAKQKSKNPHSSF